MHCIGPCVTAQSMTRMGLRIGSASAGRLCALPVGCTRRVDQCDAIENGYSTQLEMRFLPVGCSTGKTFSSTPPRIAATLADAWDRSTTDIRRRAAGRLLTAVLVAWPESEVIRATHQEVSPCLPRGLPAWTHRLHLGEQVALAAVRLLARPARAGWISAILLQMVTPPGGSRGDAC